MLFESANVVFLTKDPEKNRDLDILLKEYNVDIRYVSQTLKRSGEGCDLILIEAGDFTLKQIEAVFAACTPDKRNTPIVYIIQSGDEEKVIHLLQAYRGALIRRPIHTKTVMALLDRLLQSVALYHRASEEHQYYEALLQNSIVTKTDPKGIITFANENFCRLSGYSEAELLGKNHNIIRHPDMPDEAFKDLWETILQKKVWTGKVKNLKKDGGFYIFNAMIFPLLDKNNEIREFMAIRHDITQIEVLREEMAKEEARQKEIIHKQEMLEEVNRAKDEFLVVFTHELKTPLNAIINFSEYIAKQLQKSDIEKKEKLLELIISVRKNAGHMLENIINIIDISKLKAGKLVLNLTHVNLADMFSDIQQRFASTSDQTGVSIVYDIAPGCVIITDERRLAQVVGNILSNAVKYGKGQVKVESSCENSRFYIAVEDNGPGIKDDLKIFDLYEQGDEDAVTRSAQGTGVGLHFVKYLCQELKIDIAVERSEKLGGARFVLRGEVK